MTLRPDDETTGAWLGAPVAAPSIHNTQPWHFNIHDGGIDVRVNPARRLRVIDRDHRSMLLSVGACVFNLRLAIALDGRLPVLRPFPADGLTVARVEPGRPGRPGPGLQTLGTALFRRHTNRGPYARAVVPARILDELRAAAAAEGAELTALDRVRRDALLALMATADAAQRRDPAYRRELATWTAADPYRLDGIPVELFGPRDEEGRLPLRDFGLRVGPARPPGRPVRAASAAGRVEQPRRHPCCAGAGGSGDATGPAHRHGAGPVHPADDPGAGDPAAATGDRRPGRPVVPADDPADRLRHAGAGEPAKGLVEVTTA